MGKQSLYTVRISVDVKGYGESDLWSHLFGFRKIESHIDNATGGRYSSYTILVMKLFLCLPINSRIVLQPTHPSLLDRLFKVNGQPIFIRGGNWILSDGLLRLSKKRYKTDIKFHADMNMNMIRCWGGGLAERPEFYHYCDIYGLLVSFAFLSLSICALRFCSPPSFFFFLFVGGGVCYLVERIC